MVKTLVIILRVLVHHQSFNMKKHELWEDPSLRDKELRRERVQRVARNCSYPGGGVCWCTGGEWYTIGAQVARN